jgi:hypothetical protein
VETLEQPGSAPTTASSSRSTSNSWTREPTIIVSEAQTSTSPVVRAEKVGTPSPVTSETKSRLSLVFAAVLVFVSVLWGLAGARRTTAQSPKAVAVATQRQESASSPASSSPSEAVSTQAAPAVQPIAIPPATNAPEKPAVNAGAPKTDTEATTDITKVKIEVVPTDSTVALYGQEIKGPLVFDVKKGSRTVLEVARPGYITRRIVLDGKKSFVRIMMKLSPSEADTASPSAPVKAPASSAVPSPPVVSAAK